MQELLDRQIFEEYKNKLLRGIVDQKIEVYAWVYRKNLIRFGEKIRSQLTTIISPAR